MSDFKPITDEMKDGRKLILKAGDCTCQPERSGFWNTKLQRWEVESFPGSDPIIYGPWEFKFAREA